LTDGSNPQSLNKGDAVLVVLAASNRDPAANAAPDRFDMSRPHRRVFAFGNGIHRCPGEMPAVTIAQAGVEALIASGLDVRPLAATITYRASANARIPQFDILQNDGNSSVSSAGQDPS